MILVCSATGHPTPIITWKFNKSPIDEIKTPIDNLNITHTIFSINNNQSSSLIIRNLLNTEGNIIVSCEADNNAGYDSRQQKLTAINKETDLPIGFPTFQNNFYPIIKPLNSNVTIACQAQGSPLPMIQWFRNYELIIEGISRAKILNDGSLFLLHIIREDKGVYHCQAQNTNGLRLSDPSILQIANYPITPKSLTIEKFGSDFIDISWQSGTIDENENENFILHFKEIPENSTENKIVPKFIYLPIKKKNSIYKYSLKQLFPFTNYSLWMESENELGVSPQTNNLTVKTSATAPQLVPQSITATSITNTAILVAWKPPKRKFGKFKYYQVMYTNNDGFLPQHWRQFSVKEDFVLLSHLSSSELYHIRMKIVNEIGHGPLSKTISITTIAGTLSQCPDFKVLEIFQSHIKLQWGNPDPSKLFQHLLYNIQCWNIRLKSVNSTEKTSHFEIINTNLSMSENEYTLPLKNEKTIKCKLCAINVVGIGMPTEIQITTKNLETSNQNLFYLVKVGASFINFKWRPVSKYSFDYFLWAYRVFSFDGQNQTTKLPKIKINLSNSETAENGWFIYNFTGAFSSSQYILGLRYLCRDSDGILREYVHRSDSIFTLKSDPSLVTNIQITRGCSESRPCIEIQWNSNQQFSKNETTKFTLKYRIVSPKSFATNYSIHTLHEPSFQLDTHNKPGFGVTYEFLISKFYKRKFGKFANASIVLPESVPSDSPKDLVIQEIDSKTARLSWKPPNPIYRNGIITHYEVRIYAAGKEDTTERLLNFTETSAILSELQYFHYNIYVRAFTKAGGGSWSNKKTYYRPNLLELPVPTRIKIERKSETEIFISWELPVLSEKNKAYTTIEGFMILYSPIEFSPKWLTHISQKSSLFANIKGLKENVKYQFKVAAINYASKNGNFSSSVEENNIFPKSTSKVVQSLRCPVKDSKRLKVEWESPSISTDLLKYEISYSGNLSYITDMGFKKSEFIDTKSKSLAYETYVNRYDVILDELYSNALYKISVRAIYRKNDQYDSHIEITCSTSSNVPDIVEAPSIVGLDKDKTKVIIKLFRCSQRNGKISNYFLIVGNLNTINKRIYPLQDPDSYTFMELSVHTKSNNAQGEYIAVRKDINRIFEENGKNYSYIILGDGSHDENHLAVNKKLKKNVYYKCFVRVCLQDFNNSSCKSSPWSHPFRINDMIHNRNHSYITNQSITLNKSTISNSILIMIFLVCGVILAVALIIVGCIIKRKKSKERSMNFSKHDDIRSSILMKSSMLNGLISTDTLFASPEVEETKIADKKYTSLKLKSDIKSIPDLVNADSVLMCQDGTKLSPILLNDSKKLRISTQKSENNQERPAIPICNLYQYVTDLKAKDCALLQSEFETLNTNLDDRFTWHRSNIDSNKSKNRYANVVAYDHTSVLLTPLDDMIGSDYINANYIDSYQKQNAYIATQGPLPDTTDDFWRMVWEQRSSCIVMMTRLEERSGIKCHQYWPNRGFICYGQMIVSHIDTFILSYYTIRIFEIRHSKYSEKREIQHFQFTAWPDHGVPKLSTPLLMFIRRVRSIGKIETGPKIVHCSAGVGRTGAFIVVDTQLERIKQEKSIDVFNYVSKIRCQRNYMVQTQAQYQFILETLLEAVEDGNTEVLACNFHAHVTKLSQIGISGTNQLSGFEMEFSKLNSLASNRGRHGVMLADFVKAAGNQTVNLTKNRVRNIIPYDWNRVVLNAIRGIEGSDYINASYIDGYRERRAYIASQSPIPPTVEDFWRMIWDQHCGVVIVLNQPHEDKSHVYWPVNKSIRYQFFVVDPVVEYNMPNYILREFKVTDARDGEFRALRQFQFTQWPTHGCPKESESILDFIRQVHKTKEQFGHMEPMVIHCNTGSGRTGVFIALSIVLDRLQQESVVDMYQTVKLLHKQRIGLVQTEEQYEFCYMAVLDYLSNYEKMVEKSNLF